MLDRDKAANGFVRGIDRLSDMPDCILHHIISLLGTKEACRTTILSKRWVNIWSTGLMLDFDPNLFGEFGSNWFGEESVASRETSNKLVSFVETTLQRYSDQNLSIRKLWLLYPNADDEMTRRIDRWLRIALKNQVQALSLGICRRSILAPDYELTLILFSAKSLISLRCFTVVLPRYPSVMLTSLQSLHLSNVIIDEDMLHDIIKFCPLKKLWLDRCRCIKNLSIPSCSNLEFLHVDGTIPSYGSIVVETSSVHHFSFQGYNHFEKFGNLWPFNFSRASKINLRELNVFYIHIPDNVIDKLVTGLSSIKIISFRLCGMPKNIRIASLTLEELVFTECWDLVNIELDAPQLKTFYSTGGDLQLSSITSSRSICNASLKFTHCDLDTQSLVKINRLLSGLKCCKVFSIDRSKVSKVDFNQLCEIDAAPVEELKLSLSCSVSKKSLLIDLLDGVFWSCRPSKLSLTIHFLSNNKYAIYMSRMEIMEEVKCWKNSLKRFNVKRTNCSRLTMSERGGQLRLELRLHLYW